MPLLSCQSVQSVSVKAMRVGAWSGVSLLSRHFRCEHPGIGQGTSAIRSFTQRADLGQTHHQGGCPWQQRHVAFRRRQHDHSVGTLARAQVVSGLWGMGNRSRQCILSLWAPVAPPHYIVDARTFVLTNAIVAVLRLSLLAAAGIVAWLVAPRAARSFMEFWHAFYCGMVLLTSRFRGCLCASHVVCSQFGSASSHP